MSAEHPAGPERAPSAVSTVPVELLRGGLRELDRARTAPGRVRESAFHLLAADALLTYACEAALETGDPEAELRTDPAQGGGSGTVMDRDPTAHADFHSHLVPGVDDGARTVAETVESVQRMTQEGIRKILTTPHLDGSLTLDPELLEERLEEVSAAFDEAAAAVGEAFPEVEFRRGHEVMLDVPDVNFSDPRTRLGGTSFVLIEWPRLHLPPGTAQVLQRVRGEGYRPIVAHPERYIGVDLEVANSWRAAGAYLQVNYGSLEGRYGADARTFAFRLLRRGWADYFSSDFHGRPDRKIYKQEAWGRLTALGAGESLVYLSLTNPGRVFRDEAPLPVPPLPVERGFWAKVKEILNPESQ